MTFDLILRCDRKWICQLIWRCLDVFSLNLTWLEFDFFGETLLITDQKNSYFSLHKIQEGRKIQQLVFGSFFFASNFDFKVIRRLFSLSLGFRFFKKISKEKYYQITITYFLRGTCCLLGIESDLISMTSQMRNEALNK